MGIARIGRGPWTAGGGTLYPAPRRAVRHTVPDH
jgi:hypothetical protein